MLLDVVRIDPDRFAVTIGRGKGNVVEHALHHGLQTSRANILHRRIDGNRDIGERVDRAVGDVERHAFGLHQRDILLDQRGLRLGQDPPHVVAGERLEFDANRQASLQLRQQVRGLGDMKRAGRDEQDMIGFHRAVLGRNRRAFDQRQQVALHALARYFAADAAIPHADLVYLVQEDDAVAFDRRDRLEHELIAIQQLVRFFIDENFVRTLDRQPPRLGAAAQLAEDIADRDRAHLRARHARDFEHRHAAGRLRLDLDFLVVEFAGAQLFTKRVPRRGAGTGADQRIQHAFLGRELRARLHILALALTGLRDRDLDEIADDLFDIAADITDLGELRGLDLEERRARELRQPPRDLGLADAGRSDHENVFRQHFLAQALGELQATPSIAQRDRYRSFGVGLADDEAVEFGDDFAGGKVGHEALARIGIWWGQAILRLR